MKVLLDACVWGGACKELEAAGHDVLWAGEWIEDPGDEEILARAHGEGRILVTLDMDFSDMRNYPPAEFPGLIVLRLRQQDKPHVLDVWMRVMQVLHQEPIEGHLWIVEENRIRIRGEPG